MKFSLCSHLIITSQLHILMSDLRISSSTITLRMLKGNRKGHKSCSFLRRTVAISLMDSEFLRQGAVATQPTVRVIEHSQYTSLFSNLQSGLQWGHYLFMHYITHRENIQLQGETESKNNLIKCKITQHKTIRKQERRPDRTSGILFGTLCFLCNSNLRIK